MADPTIKRLRIEIDYSASDGYRSVAQHATHWERKPRHEPKVVMLEAIDELARLSALFGWGEEAARAVTAAMQRVEKWRNEREDVKA